MLASVKPNGDGEVVANEKFDIVYTHLCNSGSAQSPAKFIDY